MEKIGVITDAALTALVTECPTIWENGFECKYQGFGRSWLGPGTLEFNRKTQTMKKITKLQFLLYPYGESKPETEHHGEVLVWKQVTSNIWVQAKLGQN
jgi:hypothetical protein